MATVTGPRSYRIWRSYLARQPADGVYEAAWYSDSETTVEGMIPRLGPYMVMNGFRMIVRNAMEPVAYVRVEYYSSAASFDPGSMDATDVSSFTGSSVADEIACLVALQANVRLMAGGPIRHFLDQRDPRGTPRGDDARPGLVTVPELGRRRLPSVVGRKQLRPFAALERFPLLSPKAAVALLRAARSYRDAIWIGESEPELAWLLLVAALEAAAVQHKTTSSPPADRLRAAMPHLATILEACGGEAHLAQVAKQLAPLLGATERFVEFAMSFLPEPPAVRPPPYAQARWDDADWMRATLRTIYKHRSNALHNAIPIPPPMCEIPDRLNESRIPHEVPMGLAQQRDGGTWVQADTPLTLDTFAHLARGALLKWWEGLSEDRIAKPQTVPRGAGRRRPG